jgi:hypothetical protein
MDFSEEIIPTTAFLHIPMAAAGVNPLHRRAGSPTIDPSFSRRTAL